MPMSVDEFVLQLKNSGLMSAADVQGCESHFRHQNTSNFGESLAEDLVTRQILTSYQAAELLAGRGTKLVLGNYVILQKLGQGGMGLVLKAEHRRMKRLVAIKTFFPHIGGSIFWSFSAGIVRRGSRSWGCGAA